MTSARKKRKHLFFSFGDKQVDNPSVETTNVSDSDAAAAQDGTTSDQQLTNGGQTDGSLQPSLPLSGDEIGAGLMSPSGEAGQEHQAPAAACADWDSDGVR